MDTNQNTRVITMFTKYFIDIQFVFFDSAYASKIILIYTHTSVYLKKFTDFLKLYWACLISSSRNRMRCWSNTTCQWTKRRQRDVIHCDTPGRNCKYRWPRCRLSWSESSGRSRRNWRRTSSSSRKTAQTSIASMTRWVIANIFCICSSYLRHILVVTPALGDYDVNRCHSTWVLAEVQTSWTYL